MSPRRRTIPPDTQHVLNRLKIAIQTLGYSFRDIERALRYSDGYMSRVFLGAIELKVEHVLGIAKALQMAPEELAAFIYPQPKVPPSPHAYELWRRVGGFPPGMAAGPPKPDGGPLTKADLEQALKEALGKVFAALGGQLGKEPGGP